MGFHHKRISKNHFKIILAMNLNRFIWFFFSKDMLWLVQIFIKVWDWLLPNDWLSFPSKQIKNKRKKIFFKKEQKTREEVFSRIFSFSIHFLHQYYSENHLHWTKTFFQYQKNHKLLYLCYWKTFLMMDSNFLLEPIEMLALHQRWLSSFFVKLPTNIRGYRQTC